VLLDDRLFTRPAEMMDRCRHFKDASGREHLPLRRIQLLSDPHVERAGDHRHRHLDRVPVSGNPVVGGKLQAHDEWTRLVEGPLDHGHARARRQHRGPARPGELGWREPHHLLGRAAIRPCGLRLLSQGERPDGQARHDDGRRHCRSAHSSSHVASLLGVVMLWGQCARREARCLSQVLRRFESQSGSTACKNPSSAFKSLM
jgi:hypothetical protein